LTHILSDLSLPSGAGLSNQLGISGIPSITSNQIYNDSWDDDGAVGLGTGEDYENEVDLELEQDQDTFDVKMEEESMYGSEKPPRRVRIVKRLVERPKTVYERFPTFEKDKILDFTELFKGYTVHKSRISKRPFHGEFR
jgi:transcription initiation factor TFIID subunit 1, fungi type